MSQKTYTVSIVDDHPILLDGLKTLLAKDSTYEVVHSYVDGGSFLTVFKDQPTDLVIMDIHMKGKDGIECTEFIKSHHPNTKVIAYSMFLENSIIAKAIKAGVSAYLDKSSPDAVLLDKIKNVMAGSEDILLDKDKLTQELLSVREKEIALALLEGMKPEEIGGRFFISTLTVRTHIRNLHGKLNISSSHELAKLLAEKPHLLGLS